MTPGEGVPTKGIGSSTKRHLNLSWYVHEIDEVKRLAELYPAHIVATRFSTAARPVTADDIIDIGKRNGFKVKV